MKDTNNNPITEEEFTKGESVGVEMPVEKTVDELRKNIALHFYNANYPQAYTQEEVYRYEKEVDYFMALLQEVKSQVRREVVEEINNIIKNKYKYIGLWEDEGVEEIIEDLKEITFINTGTIFGYWEKENKLLINTLLDIVGEEIEKLETNGSETFAEGHMQCKADIKQILTNLKKLIN